MICLSFAVENDHIIQFNLLEKQDSFHILNYQIRACDRCRLSATRRHALVGEGDLESAIMFVALSPGVKEDIQNKMFVGPSGQVFNKLLSLVGIDRKKVFMTNLVKCMLPQNRKPKMDEIDSCSTFLDEELLINQPDVIVPLGYYAARAVLAKYHADYSLLQKNTIKINFGELLSFGDQIIYPLPHPASLLYNPSFEASTITKYKRLQAFIRK